jgi:hypothetical protein
MTSSSRVVHPANTGSAHTVTHTVRLLAGGGPCPTISGTVSTECKILPTRRQWRCRWFRMWTVFDGQRNCITNFPEILKARRVSCAPKPPAGVALKDTHDSTSRPLLHPTTVCGGRRARCEALGTRCPAGGPSRRLRVVVVRAESVVRTNCCWRCSVANWKRRCGGRRGGRRIRRWSAGRIRTLERCERQLGNSSCG